MPRPKKLLEATSVKERPAKKEKSRKPSIAGVMNAVAAKADTDGTSINVAETKRVIRSFVDQVKLEYKDPVERLNFLIKNFM